MKIRRAMRATMCGAAGVLVLTTPLTAISAPARAATSACTTVTDDSWPQWVQGRPANINPRTTPATYMWHDRDGWHVRVTHHRTHLRTFSGQLVTQGKFVKVHAVRLERGDHIKVSANRHEVTFSFKNYGKIDGLNFKTNCAPSIQFIFESDAKRSPTKNILIGRKGRHPTSNPFVITR